MSALKGGGAARALRRGALRLGALRGVPDRVEPRRLAALVAVGVANAEPRRLVLELSEGHHLEAGHWRKVPDGSAAMKVQGWEREEMIK